MSIFAFYKRHKLVADFFIRMFVLMVSGALILLWLKSIPGLQMKIVNSTPVYHFGNVFIEISRILVNLFGYTSEDRLMRMPNMEFVAALCTPWNDCLYLAWPCLGIKVMAVFIALILVFPGEAKHKLWFIPLGLLMIQIFNVFRFSGLMMIIYHYPMSVITNFDLWNLGIGYHDLFNWVLYFVIFGLFILWIKYFGMPALRNYAQNPSGKFQ